MVDVDIYNNNQAGTNDYSQVELNHDRDDAEIIEAQAQVTQVFIRVSTPDYDIHKSVFYTHNFYNKIMKEDGSAVAKCMVCWEENKEKNVFPKVADSNTEEPIDAFHPNFAKNKRELKKENDEKRSRFASSRKRFKAPTDNAKKQSKILPGANKTLKLEPRINADLHHRYDDAHVLFCAKTLTAFIAMQHDHILIKALLPNSHK